MHAAVTRQRVPTVGMYAWGGVGVSDGLPNSIGVHILHVELRPKPERVWRGPRPGLFFFSSTHKKKLIGDHATPVRVALTEGNSERGTHETFKQTKNSQTN